jgi:uncharacterized protein
MCKPSPGPIHDPEEPVRLVGTVAELVRYPVKSMQGQPVERTSVSARGLEADRTYAVRDLETGKVASAKQPNRWRTLLDCHASVEDDLRIRLPDGRTLTPGSHDLDRELTDLLGRDVRLVDTADGELGTYDSQWPAIAGVTIEGDHEFPVAMGTEAATFADLAAIHLMTSSTMGRLRALAPDAAIEPRRFRPNLVIDTGGEARFLEDAWVGHTLRIGEHVEVQVTLRTPRCVMTTVEQPGLERDLEVLRAAATNRHDLGVGTFACAGVYAEVTTEGPVALGDPVTVV